MPSTDLTGNVIEPELGRHILLELTDLNADFIALLLDNRNAVAINTSNNLETAALKALSKPATRRLSGCAFALFDLHLQDTTIWQSLRDRATPVDVSAAQNSPIADSDRISLFILSALMYLRHLANINEFFAKLSFDASPDVLKIISELPIHRLRRIANRHPGLLRARFSDYPGAWSDLLQLSKRNDTEPMLPAKILGYQHLAQPRT